MDHDDPFFQPKGDDRTVIRPIPGGRRHDLHRQRPTRSPSRSTASGPLPQLGKLNLLESAASGLMALLTRLTGSRSFPDPDGLKNQLINEIKRFQNMALKSGVDQKMVYTARYVLCTALDEAVLNTPWGQSSNWAQKSLLSNFHKEVSGGKRFFQILKSLGKDPSKNIDLLELMYLCLALGYQGHYRIAKDGKNQLTRIREWLYQLIDRERGHPIRELSPHWVGVTDQRNPLMRLVPLWVFGAVAAALLAAVFSGLVLHLNHLSDPAFKSVYAVKAPAIAAPKPVVRRTPPPIVANKKPPVTLSGLLSGEISAGKLKVDENAEQGKITLQGDNLFRSGRTTVDDAIEPLLHKIGKSLNQIPGRILITGHTDSDPISNARFPSNWHLSQARADAVAAIIGKDLDDPGRITTEGRSDLEPIAANTTRAGKAKNRRVEINLFK